MCVWPLLIRPRETTYTLLATRLTLHHTSAADLHEAIAASQVHMPRPSEAPELKALPCPEPVPNPCVAEVRPALLFYARVAPWYGVVYRTEMHKHNLFTRTAVVKD